MDEGTTSKSTRVQVSPTGVRNLLIAIEYSGLPPQDARKYGYRLKLHLRGDMKDSIPLHRPDFWRQLRYDLVWIYQGSVPEHLRRGFMQGHVLSAWYVLEGEAEVTVRGHTTRAGKGSWLFAAPGDREQVLSDNIRLLSIRYFVGRHPGIYFFRQPHSLVVPHQDAPVLLEHARHLIDVFQAAFGTAERGSARQLWSAQEYLIVQSVFLQWLAAYMDVANSLGLELTISEQGDERVIKALNLIGRDAGSYGLTETWVAEFVGVSLSHFRRLFITHTGKTWRQLSEEARLDSTFSALRLTSQSIKEIAYAHGFRSSQNFSAWFQGKVNQSPSTYRDLYAMGSGAD